MAWSRDRVDSSNINNGNEYQKGDRVSRQQLNAMVNAGLYSQDFVEALTETPDVEVGDSSEKASVSLVPYIKNNKTFYKFKFKNIKGPQGPQGNVGKDADIVQATAELSIEEVDVPSVQVQLGGTPLERTFHFVFKGILGGGSGGGSSVILYNETGQNTNGAMTQKATTDAINDTKDNLQKQIDNANDDIESIGKEIPTLYAYVDTVDGNLQDLAPIVHQNSQDIDVLENSKVEYEETEEVTITVNRLLDLIYPINSIRMSDNGNEQSFMGGTWIITGQGRTIIGAGSLGDNQYTVGDLIEAGLPNIEGSVRTTQYPLIVGSNETTGSFTVTNESTTTYISSGSGTASRPRELSIDASKSNPIYGKANTVHMNSFVTYIYKRIG